MTSKACAAHACVFPRVSLVPVLAAFFPLLAVLISSLFLTNTVIHFATGIPQKGTRTKRSRIVGGKTRSFAQEKRGEASRQRGKNRRVLATVPAFHFFLQYILSVPRLLSVFRLVQSISGHVVRAKKRQ